MRKVLILSVLFFFTLTPLLVGTSSAQVKPSFSISVSKTKAIPGQWLTIKGRVPSHSSQKLELIRTLYGGVMATGASNGEGYYSFRTRMPSMPEEGFAVRVVGGAQSRTVSVESQRQYVSLSGSANTMTAVLYPPMRRTVRLERRTGPASWETLTRKTASAEGRVQFAGKTGAVYRAYAEPLRDIVATYSLPLYTRSVKVSSTVTKAPAPTRVYSPQPDSPNGAAARHGWYPAALTWDWIYGMGMEEWTNWSSGTGSSLLTYGGLWSMSGPEGDRASFGSLSSTYKKGGSSTGSWEIRGRAVQRGTTYTPYTVRYSLVPAHTRDGLRPKQEIVVAETTGYGSTVRIGVRDGESQYARTVRGFPHNGINWHLYAVQVNGDRVTWLINGTAVASWSTSKSFGAPWVPRVEMIGKDGARMTATTLGTDWIRQFSRATGVNASTGGFDRSPL